jgi:hypothetical protein
LVVFAISTATQDEIDAAHAAASSKVSSKYQSEIQFSEEDKTLTLLVRSESDASILFNYTVGCNSFNQMGPTWVSDELDKAYFIVPDCGMQSTHTLTLTDSLTHSLSLALA